MFHLRAKIIGRSSAGARSVAGAVAYRVGSRTGAAAMAYRAGEALRDARTGRMFDYSRKAMIDADGFGILHSEIMLPAGAPAWMADRQALIDAIEARETRADAQLLREIELSLPRELTFEQQLELVRAFVRSAFVSRGMVADIAIHDELASDGGRNPHAHILLSMRSVTPDGFGNKVRAWNSTELLREWRMMWAEMANERLAAYGHERRLDPRSHRDRGIILEPDTYVGPSKGRGFEGLLHAERQESRDAGKQKNIDLLAEEPDRLIDAISREKATFTLRDIAYALRRATGLESDDPLHWQLLKAAMGSRDLVTIPSDLPGPPRFTTRDMIECEAKMARAAHTLAKRNNFDIDVPPRNGLSVEQQRAFLHTTYGADLVAICGVAGAGKTTTLSAIAEAYEKAGYRVRGAALAGIAARILSDEAGIQAATLASTFHGWDRVDPRGRPAPIAPLEQGDVFILDEAGLVGSRDMVRLLAEAQRVKAKVILVGDTQQLQSIEAGAAFRAIVDTYGAAELRDVRRQRNDWQRTASALFADQRSGEALALYDKGGAIHAMPSTEAAMDQLVADWMKDRRQGGSQIVITPLTADVRLLNAKLRGALREAGELGPDVLVTIREQERDITGEITERARHARFALGERILFTKNDRDLDVRNGMTGQIAGIEASGKLNVAMADGRMLNFSMQDYAHLALGYAMTVHKAQGGTFDRAYFLATERTDAHVGYVAMTRHREEAQLYYGRDAFPRERDLRAAFDRQRPQDSTLDYVTAAGRMRRTDGGDRTESRTNDRSPNAAPPSEAASASERLERSIAERQGALSRDRGRERSLGD